jgi:hypothetical protein
MGAGAGYSIETKDVKIVSDVQINSFEKIREDNNAIFRYDVIDVDCTISLIGSVRATSYMYGCDWIKDVPMTVTGVSINFLHDESNAEISEGDIADILINVKNYVGKAMYGGGWSHSTFDGTFELRPEGDYADDIDSVLITIDNEYIVDFIDLAVTGDNKEYSIVLNGEPVDSFEDQDEAIDQLDAWIRDDISENGIDSIDFSECFVEELYWQENVNGEIDYVDPWYDNIVYRADPADFEDFAEVSEEIDEEFANPIDEDFDI